MQCRNDRLADQRSGHRGCRARKATLVALRAGTAEAFFFTDSVVNLGAPVQYGKGGVGNNSFYGQGLINALLAGQ